MRFAMYFEAAILAAMVIAIFAGLTADILIRKRPTNRLDSEDWRSR
jgi:hypothetical protein